MRDTPPGATPRYAYWASGTPAGAGAAGALAGADVDVAGAARLVSMTRWRWPAAASTASTMLVRMKADARMVVERVSRSAAPRALIRPPALPPPMPSPPPSDRCIRMTAHSAMAIRLWTTRTKVDMQGLQAHGVPASACSGCG